MADAESTGGGRAVCVRLETKAAVKATPGGRHDDGPAPDGRRLNDAQETSLIGPREGALVEQLAASRTATIDDSEAGHEVGDGPDREEQECGAIRHRRHDEKLDGDEQEEEG